MMSSLSAVRGYELRERIGRGSFGEVHRAYQPAVDREVAIKIILPEYADQPDFIRGFESEARLVARLEHLHITPLYDFWREPGGAYLVMRYLRGGSLRDRLDQVGALSPLEVAGILDQVAAGLAVAHRQSVIHRDIKPANIMLDEEGNAYLSDFGIAKDLASRGVEPEHPDAMIGTPSYLSPEQIRSEPVTPQTDIYSLGVVLYEMLSGEHPFADSSIMERLSKLLKEPLPVIEALDDSIREAINDVIQQATAKDPAARFPDALAMASAFNRAINRGVQAIATSAELGENPFKGLRAFEEADAGDFFGREALIQRLLSRLGEEVPLARFLAVVGPSGSGKSSVVKAGLLPALRKGALPGSEQWYMTVLTPGEDPLAELETALLSLSAVVPDRLSERLRADTGGLLSLATEILPDDDSHMLLVVDQLEELFTLAPDEKTSSFFLSSLHAAVTDPASRVRVITTIRADFYDRPLMHPGFSELVQQRTEVVVPMTPEELEQTITGPAHRANVKLEEGLVGAIVADVAEQPGALPMLQYALTELFEQNVSGIMTLDAYHRIGGVLGALAGRAEDIFQGLDTLEQEATRQLFLRLIALGEGTEDTRRRIRMSELPEVIGGRADVSA